MKLRRSTCIGFKSIKNQLKIVHMRIMLIIIAVKQRPNSYNIYFVNIPFSFTYLIVPIFLVVEKYPDFPLQ